MGEVADVMIKKLQDGLNPVHIELKDQSHLHEGHAGHDPRGESHFKLTIVTDMFESKSRPECHRMIYNLLQSELKDRVHALSIQAFTPADYQPER